MVDWLHTCTLLERVWSIQSGLHFDKVKSKKITTVVIPIVIVCVGLTLLHEPLNRESIFDPSPYEGRWSWFSYIIIPFVINIIVAVTILVNLSRIKSTASLQSSSARTIHCVQTISPIVLIIFALQ
ncbi:unnamed protein product, partial [Rotaria magnacalcarata]